MEHSIENSCVGPEEREQEDKPKDSELGRVNERRVQAELVDDLRSRQRIHPGEVDPRPCSNPRMFVEYGGCALIMHPSHLKALVGRKKLGRFRYSCEAFIYSGWIEAD